MARKKKIDANKLISMYMNYVLEYKKKPRTVKSFSIDHNFDEDTFYKYFKSLFQLEQTIFKTFLKHTLHHLANSNEYANYSSRNKLLTFYYTFFEILTANRQYIKIALKKEKNNFKKLKSLAKLRKSYLKYIMNLGIETINFNQENLEKIQLKSIAEIGWLQLLYTMKFWLEDTSKEFEKTDILIEKSVNTTFDILDTTALKSMMDLGKFLFKEKMK